MQVIQLSLWDDLNDADRDPATADVVGLLARLESEIAPLSTTQKLDVAGEGIRRLGEIYGIRAEATFEEIEYLSHRGKEPVLPLNAFDGYIRQSMMVDLEQFIETPELPEIEREYHRVSVVRELSVTEALAEIEAVEEVVSDLEWWNLAHAEPIHLWAGQIWTIMLEASEMSLAQLQHSTGLSMVDLWLGLLLGDTGCVMEPLGGDFYDAAQIKVVNQPDG